MKSSLVRVRALENLIRSKPTWPTSDCLMKDGNKKRFFGMMVLQPFLDGEIVTLTTDDADMAAMLRQMDADNTVEIKLI